MTKAVEDGNDPEALIKLDMHENEIDEATYKNSIDLEINLTGDNKIEYYNAWLTYRKRTYKIEKQRVQALSMVRGKCMHVLIEKM